MTKLILPAVLVTALLAAGWTLASTSLPVGREAAPSAPAPEERMSMRGQDRPKPAASPQATPSPEATPAAKPEIETHTVAKGELSLAIDADGTFEAIDPQEVKLKLESYAGELIVVSAAANGAAAKKGDEILKLDAPPLKKQIDAAENDLKATRANLVRAEANVKAGAEADALALEMARHALKMAETNLTWWKETDDKNGLAQQELWARRLLDYISDQEEELDQLLKMYKSEELTNATAEIVVKRQKRWMAWLKDYLTLEKDDERKYKEVWHPTRGKQIAYVVDQAKQALQQAELNAAQGAVLRETERVRAQAALALQEEQLAKLKKDWDALAVRATMDGSVFYGTVLAGAWQGHDAKLLRAGEKVAANQVLMTLFTPGLLRIKTDLPETQRFWIRDGMAAAVTPVSIPEAPIDGKCGAVSFITSARSGGPGYELTIDLGPVDARFVPGMKAAVHVDVAELKDALVVPTAAIARGKVWIHGKDGKDEARAVVTGRFDGKMTEIRRGLKEGDVILAQAKK